MLKMLDLFSGVGVGVAAQAVGGIEEYGVEIMPAAIATRDGLGFNTPYNDVWEIDKAQELGFGPDWAMWASPPCPTFSIAGRGTGRKALDNVLAAIHDERYKDIHAIKALGAEIGGSDGDKTALVLTPLAYIHHYRPRFIGMEQVPAVLPVWEAHRGPLEELGYSVWVGYLTSEMYGVPQTRKRAYLIARRDGIQAAPPTPTHSRYYSRDPKRMDEGVLPWVSMAEALGWGDFIAEKRMGSGMVERYGDRPGRDAELPAFTIRGSAGGMEPGSFRLRRGLGDRPSPTITGGGTETGGAEPIAKLARYTESESWVGDTRRLSVEEAARLQSYPTGWGFTERPALTVTGHGLVTRHPTGQKTAVAKGMEDGTFVPRTPFTIETARKEGEQREDYISLSDRYEVGSVNCSPEENARLQSFPMRQELKDWEWIDRPATTVAGDPRITAREHHYHGEQSSTSLRLTLDEAKLFQSFPDGIDFKGRRGDQYLIIGNSVPPLQAMPILQSWVDIAEEGA